MHKTAGEPVFGNHNHRTDGKSAEKLQYNLWKITVHKRERNREIRDGKKSAEITIMFFNAGNYFRWKKHKVTIISKVGMHTVKKRHYTHYTRRAHKHLNAIFSGIIASAVKRISFCTHRHAECDNENYRLR